MNSNQTKATITIPVDLCNPGQFFACCGLLELAHRLTQTGRRAVGWFQAIDDIKAEFIISAFNREKPVTLEKITRYLKKCPITAQQQDSKEGPVFLGEPFLINLDWRNVYPQNNLVKTFAGKQNIFEILQTLQSTIPIVYDNTLLDFSGYVDKAVTSFNVEKAEDTIDAGFSMDVQVKRLHRAPYLFVELLALIGTQRFCPKGGRRRLDRIYYAWKEPLPAPIAAIVVAQPLAAASVQGFSFQMYKRDPQGRYKGFATSRKIKL